MLPELQHNASDQKLPVAIPAEELASMLLQAIQNTADFIATFNCAGEFTFVNDSMLKAIGCRREEFVGKHFSAIFSPDNPAAVVQDVGAGGLESGWNGDCVLRRRNGTDFSVFLNVGPLADKEGRVTGMFGIARDITERKQAELAIRREASIVAFSDDAIIGKDMNSIVTSWNRGAERIFGYTADEMVGTSIMRLIPAERRDEEIYILDRIKRGESVDHFETVRQTKDGRRIDVSVTASPIKDATGKSIGVSKVARDITERKRAQEQIAEQAALLDKARDAILVRDLEGKIVFWNNGAERIYGWTREEAIGRSAGELLYANPNKFLETQCPGHGQGRMAGELLQLTWDKREINIEARWTLIRDNDGRSKSVLAINTDITDKKKIEAQFMRAQRMESIGTLAGGIAHDLNNILALNPAVNRSSQVQTTGSSSQENSGDHRGQR